MLKGVPTLIVVDGDDDQATKAGSAALEVNAILSKRIYLKDLTDSQNTKHHQPEFRPRADLSWKRLAVG